MSQSNAMLLGIKSIETQQRDYTVPKKYYNGQQHGASFQIYECKEDEVAISALLSTGVSGPALHKRCTFIPKTDRFPATTILRIHFGLRLHQSHPSLSINDGNQLFQLTVNRSINTLLSDWWLWIIGLTWLSWLKYSRGSSDNFQLHCCTSWRWQVP